VQTDVLVGWHRAQFEAELQVTQVWLAPLLRRLYPNGHIVQLDPLLQLRTLEIQPWVAELKVYPLTQLLQTEAFFEEQVEHGYMHLITQTYVEVRE
jgi:hypothetical protein